MQKDRCGRIQTGQSLFLGIKKGLMNRREDASH